MNDQINENYYVNLALEGDPIFDYEWKQLSKKLKARIKKRIEDGKEKRRTNEEKT